MQRLYVGGLSHTITQKDLKDRFGKFGQVEDVELRTRKDDEGVPYKTFSYININITDADLKKCMTVLNKSKWKGGTLQIETAKESFLHRLAEERQTAEQQRLLPPAPEDQKQKMLDSLSKAGVENFTMKAAVPGTEVPGHEDWVVSKFGRVLPVLQLKCQKGSRARTLKYDPSKYSHNIRKLDRPSTDQSASDLPTPVSQLTWELQGGDDDISKKRRGEFPAYEPPKRKKIPKDAVNSLKAEGKPRLKRSVDSVALTEAPQVTNGHKPPSTVRPAQMKGPPLTLSDIDSDDEIHRIVAVQSSSHDALQQDEDKLEVVGLDYLVTPGRARQQQKGGHGDEEENDYDSADTDELLASRKPPPPPPRSSSPPPQERPTLTAGNISGNNTDRKTKTKKKSKAGEETDAEEPSTQKRRDAGKLSSQKQSKKTKALPVVKPSSSESESDDDDDDDEEEEESADSSSDSDYEAMFSNVTRLEISLADLQKLAEEFQDTSETTAPSSLSVSERETKPPKKGTTPEEILAALMEDDSSEEEQQSKKKKKKKRKADATTQLLPAFKGTKALNEGSETEEGQKEEEEGEGTEVKKLKMDHKATSSKMNGQKHTETESSEDEEEEEEEPKKKEAVVKNMAEKAESVSSSSSDEEEEEEELEKKGKVFKNMAEKAQKESSSSSDEDEEEEEVPKANQTVLTSKAAAASSSSSSSEEDEDEILPAKDAVKAAPPPAPHSESSSSEEEEEEEEEKQAPLRVPLGAKEEKERQRKANIRRLAAVQQRQKETEENKKLIQGALANLDAPAAGAGKHIVFGSDDDEEADSDDEQQTTSEIKTPKKTLFQDSQSENEAPGHKNTTTKEKKLSGTHLFGGSEEEEDADEEEDGSRFDIRPEFEGRAGHKLMELQSRFGKDERFKMDSRFLEQIEDKEGESEKKKSGTEEEEALEEERKKSLSILQSVLGSSQHTSSSSKTTSKAKTFRDVSALHYDPSREEHAAFETKTEDTKKESKAARRKKREEAQKLPEVSKEIYYDVSGDLKAVFGQTKEEEEEEEAVAEKEETNWDQEEEKKKEEAGEQVEQPTLESSLLSADRGAEKEEASGFKFSFFGDDVETGSGETAEYKIESIQAPKLSWQQDPRFHDSSSDEEEEKKGQEEEEKTQSNVIAKIEETPAKTGLFFFYPEDSRLTEGPKLFCRSSQLEEQKEQWEERRTELRQEYRKKHKDARRKLKTSVKS
ncbi:nucleolar protein 8 isoform X1 [Trematomus bernacchii]|uniref:nucleolar protein 8 isoform X1 n=1 Tax=Trematomus bernacchii TaxID=40690 RepID=UPI00146E6B2D|nr:nucleolar protein 8 isoform X1 [Trematomus bernacchii]